MYDEGESGSVMRRGGRVMRRVKEREKGDSDSLTTQVVDVELPRGPHLPLAYDLSHNCRNECDVIVAISPAATLVRTPFVHWVGLQDGRPHRHLATFKHTLLSTKSAKNRKCRVYRALK